MVKIILTCHHLAHGLDHVVVEGIDLFDDAMHNIDDKQIGHTNSNRSRQVHVYYMMARVGVVTATPGTHLNEIISPHINLGHVP